MLCSEGGRDPCRKLVGCCGESRRFKRSEAGGRLAVRLWNLAARVFPERQLLLRTGGDVRSISLPGWLQAAALSACVISVSGVAHLVAGNIHAHHMIKAREATANLLDRSKNLADATTAEVRNELEAVQKQLADLGELYGRAQGRLTALTAENGALRGDLGAAQARFKTAEQAAGRATQLAKTLEDVKGELAKTAAQRASLQARIQQLENELQAASTRADQRKGVAALGHALENFGVEHNKHTAGQDPVQSSDASKSPDRAPEPIQGQGQGAGNQRDLTAAKDEALVAGQAGDAKTGTAPSVSGKAGELERLVASTGLNIVKLIGRIGPLPAGEGGPFVALDAKHAPVNAENQNQKRLEILRNLVKTLPLAEPLAHYQVESPFGRRKDPFNGHEAFHDGVDMSAPYRSPVFNTGPGIVSFAGGMGDYGRVVEIDHGHGIVTRYAHLHRILVERGQKIRTRTEVGELGSSGRATGPHVHYEILIDGEPTDPEKFMQAGKNVVQVDSK